MTRAAIYTRISEDKEKDTEDEGLGVARQEQDCRALCQQKGWQVAGVYEDNDRSAFSGKTRENYDLLLDDVKNHQVDAIVAWHPDRLHRSPRELEAFIDLLDLTGVIVTTCRAGDWDLSTPDGRMTARILGDIARRESEHKSDRIKSKHKQLAEGGKYVGGARRPFGYEWITKPGGEREGIRINPDEIELVKDAAARVLRGESLYSICHDWNRKAIPTVTGVPWNTKTLKQILTSGRVAGYRDHHHQPVTKSDQWKAILEEDDWRKVRAILLDPARGRTRVPRSYLLGTGELRCGSCGGKLVASPQHDTKGQLIPRYGCRREKGGCGKVSAPAPPIERIVTNAVKQVLRDPDFVARLQGGAGSEDDQAQQAEVAALEASLEELGKDYYSAKLISRPEYLAVHGDLVAKLDHAKALVAATTRRRPSKVLAGIKDIDAEWEGLGLDRQKAIINACMESVTIASAQGRARANWFDETRVGQPVWRV